jgi:uncharacterized protein involved in outer membrane biogenesis
MPANLLTPRRLRALVWLGGVIALFTVLGFFVLPPLLKAELQKTLSAELRRDVSIGDIAVNPYTLTLTVSKVDIKERGGADFISFDTLYANAELSSVFRLAPVLKELRLSGPHIRVARTAVGRYNFSDILEAFLAKPGGGPTPRFALNNIVVEKGRIDFDDQPAGSKHEITDIGLGIPFISSIPSLTNVFVEPRLSAKVNGAPLELSGKSKPFRDSLETELALDIDNFALPRLNEYLPADLKIKIPSGRFDTKLAIKFLRSPDKAAKLTVAGDISVAELVLTETAGKPLLKLPKLSAAIAEFEPLARSAKLAKISIEAPEIMLRRDKSGHINWLAVLPAAKPAVPADKDAKPYAVELAELVLSKAKISFDDDMPASPWRAVVASLDVGVKGFTTAPGTPVQLQASLGGVTVTRTGTKDAVLNLASLQVRDASLDLAKHELTLGEVLSSGGKLAAVRDKDGRLDVEAMFAPVAESAPTPAPTKDAPPAWIVSLKKLSIDGYGLTLKDETNRRVSNLSVEPFALSAQDLSTRKDSKGKFELKATLNKKGTLNVAGALALAPLSGDMSIDAKAIEILPFQPYFANKVNISVTGGDIALKGAVKWKLGAAGEAPVSGDFSGVLDLTDFASVERRSAEDFFKAKSLHIGTVKGTLAPLNFAIEEIALADFYSRLIVLPEGRLNLQDIVRKPGEEAASVIPPAGTPPAAAVGAAAPAVTTKSAGATTTTATVAPPPADPLSNYLTRIGRITVQGGNINFSDRFIKPNYSANLTAVGGTVTRISPETPADLDLRGTVDNSAPLLISGKFNPLAKDLFVDIKGSVKGFDMSPMSPYSGRYIGYAIEKGKLSMDVAYKLENRQLTASNKLLLTQLTLGEKIDNPEATKLPVTLALALLKDRNGNIDLELPITGSLDDPQFSVGGIVVKVIINLIVKAVTAPFALLGALFGGGGEELGWIEFDYGYALIGAANADKLGKLVKALQDRPALNVEIAGRVDPEQDKEGLRHAALEHKVATQKFRALARGGTPVASVAEVKVEPAEYLQYLERAYDAEKFPKPRNLIGLAKSLPKEEMEKLILSNVTIADSDLRQLAEQRAKAVQQALLKAGISNERVFLLDSRISAPEAKDKAKASRADLSLK